MRKMQKYVNVEEYYDNIYRLYKIFALAMNTGRVKVEVGSPAVRYMGIEYRCMICDDAGSPENVYESIFRMGIHLEEDHKEFTVLVDLNE